MNNGGPLVPEHVVAFLNKLPLVGDPIEWITTFREALRVFLGDVDWVVMKVNANCDLEQPEAYRPLIDIAQTAGSVQESLVLTTPFTESSPSERVMAEIRQSGLSLEAYHEPVVFNYFYGGTVAYLGTILLFRERSKQPIGERTRVAMAALEPFLIFALSDLVTRHHYFQPIDRVFSQILREVANESKLSVQDIRILSLMLMGLSYKQVADRMGLSIDTIRKHTKRIYRKTRTGSLPELFAKYFTPRFGIEGLGEDDSL